MNPYETAALPYFEGGFSPLPALGKLVVVKQASGRHPMAPKERVEKWTRSHSPFNIALRLPKNVLALDIDAYKGDIEKLEKLERELGKLPETWNSDSRGGDGGKILFRIPDDYSHDKWESNISGITVVQHTHRYVMALPSYNKESDSRYKWYKGLGGSLVPDYQIPTVDDLTELPYQWAAALWKTVDLMYHENSGISNDELEDYFNNNDPCTYMQVLTEMCCERIQDNYDSNVHDTGLSMVGMLVKAASDGHSGIVQAMDRLAETFLAAPRRRDLGTEWNNILSFVLANVETDCVSEVDSCILNLNLNIQKMQAQIHMRFEDDLNKLVNGTNLRGSKLRQHLMGLDPKRK
jgi:hypothetical protein